MSGANLKNPGRYADRGDAPATKPLGYCPRHLTQPQKDIWAELVEAAPKGLLQAADEFALEIVVRLIERSRTEPMKASEVAVLMNLLGKLGMTPSDRARLSIAPAPTSPENDPWAAL